MAIIRETAKKKGKESLRQQTPGKDIRDVTKNVWGML